VGIASAEHVECYVVYAMQMADPEPLAPAAWKTPCGQISSPPLAQGQEGRNPDESSISRNVGGDEGHSQLHADLRLEEPDRHGQPGDHTV
jgi:hypothetical protein